MQQSAVAQTVRYRGFRLELDRTTSKGWIILIHAPRRRGVERLRNSIPGGLACLLEEARLRIDRRLDGAAWHRQP